MRDYKVRPGPKGRKPAKSRGAPPRKGRAEALPRGFKPLVPPPAAPRPERAQTIRSGIRTIARIRVRTALFVAAVAWLVAGSIVGATALWDAPLREVRLQGNVAVTPDEVLHRAGLAAGLPMHQLDPYELARRIGEHPRVNSADVRRLYPGRVAIRLQERVAELRVALRDGQTAVLDAENMVLDVLPAGRVAPDTILALPLISGVARNVMPNRFFYDAAVNRGRAALVALRELQVPDSGRVVVEGGDPFLLTLRLSDGRRLIVPHEQLEPALRAFRALTEQAPDLLRGHALIDLSAVGDDGTGRIFLRRR